MLIYLLLAISYCWHIRLEKLRMNDQQKLDAIADTLAKAKTEILGEIATLKAGQVAGTPLDFSRLEALATDLDAIVPDAPATPSA